MAELSRTSHIFAAAAVASLAFGIAPASADEVADFYKGKQITFSIGYSAGGGYDLYTRMLATRFGAHIPGKPDVIATNMPGGGSLKVANFIYNVAPKDGTSLGVFSAPVAVEPLLGRKNAKFDAQKFGWLGNMLRDTHSCVVWHKAKIKTLQDIIDAKEPVVFGAAAAGSYGNQHARVLQSMLGANIRMVLGYRGIKGVSKALQTGELTAACAMAASTLKSAFRQLKDSGQFKVIVQFGQQPHPFLDNAPMFYSLLKNKEDVRVADFFFSQSSISRPVAAPPGIPKARLAALRAAFAAALRDPVLLARAKRLGVDVTPEPAETVEKAMAALYATPPAVLAKVKKIMGRK